MAILKPDHDQKWSPSYTALPHLKVKSQAKKHSIQFFKKQDSHAFFKPLIDYKINTKNSN